MPLTGSISFKAALQKHNRIAVPKLMRWQFKMEPEEVLRVGVYLPGSWEGWLFFHARMSKDGRILVPLIILSLISREPKPNLERRIFNVTIEPT